MSGHLYVLDDDRVRVEPDVFAWKEFMDAVDRTIEISEGYTPTGRWQLVTFFLGISKPGVFGGPFFFATELAKGATTETMEMRRDQLLSRDKAEALAFHVMMLNELRPISGRGTK